MPANGRWDLTRRLKGWQKQQQQQSMYSSPSPHPLLPYPSMKLKISFLLFSLLLSVLAYHWTCFFVLLWDMVLCSLVEICQRYTGCPSRNVPDFGRVFLRSNYTDITQNTYIQSSMVTEILAREKCGLLWCLRSILCPWSDPLDLHRDNPAVACSSQRRPWLRNRCLECIVVGSQWTTMTRVRVFCSSI